MLARSRLPKLLGVLRELVMDDDAGQSVLVGLLPVEKNTVAGVGRIVAANPHSGLVGECTLERLVVPAAPGSPPSATLRGSYLSWPR